MTFSANNELALHVADPNAAEAFYTRMLGCTVVDRTPDCVALTSGALRLYLLRDPGPAHDAVVPSFDVPDRAAALVQLLSAGCTLIPVGPHAPGESYVRDPHGIVFDVIERPGDTPAGRRVADDQAETDRSARDGTLFEESRRTSPRDFPR